MSDDQPTTTDHRCEGCHHSIEGKARFRMRAAERAKTLCRRCALIHRPMLFRSARVASVVGTFLVLLNQGDALFASGTASGLWWKIPLTYCVPFCVATYGALANGQRTAETGRGVHTPS